MELIASRNLLDLQIQEVRTAERRQVLKDIRTKIITYQISLADLADTPAQKHSDHSPTEAYCWLCRARLKKIK